jgi:hypothetical protein
LEDVGIVWRIMSKWVFGFKWLRMGSSGGHGFHKRGGVVTVLQIIRCR